MLIFVCAEHSYLALVTLGSKLVTLSVMLRLNQPSLPSPLPELQSTDLYCGLANMVSVKCGAGCANLNDNLLVCGQYLSDLYSFFENFPLEYELLDVQFISNTKCAPILSSKICLFKTRVYY